MAIFPYDEEDYLTPGFNPNLPRRRRPALPERVMPGVSVGGAPNIGPAAPPVNPNPSPLPEFRPGMSRADEYSGRKAEYMAGTPGRGKSALKGALQGFLGGGGLIGAGLGAAEGAIDPRALREQEFNRRVRPQILERFGFEDQDRAAQAAAQKAQQEQELNQARIGELESQTYKNRLPAPVPVQRPRPPVHSDRGLYDPETNRIIPGTEPLPKEEKPPAAHWARDASGNYVDLNAPENKGRKVRGYDRPREPKAPKEGKKVVPMTTIREAVKASGGKMTTSEVKAKFIEQGYRIVD